MRPTTQILLEDRSSELSILIPSTTTATDGTVHYHIMYFILDEEEKMTHQRINIKKRFSDFGALHEQVKS